ncbi:MBG domain-containing protein, partial [Flavobacterium sp. MAHUQ-51]|uniref:MBG domain-containing protein n=1 Tax=Flavobacterium sp. GCM10022190 TaxID=3252639 RepID=UPI003612858A
VNGDALDYSLATTATQFSGVGSYPIAITLGSNPNYSITPTDSELTITPKSATIVADGKSKIYGEVNPLLTAQVSGTVNGDALDYSLATTATQFSGVGSYPIAITLGSNPNYSITPTDSELTITPKSATIVADGKSKIYGEVNPLLTAQISGTVNGDALDYSLATTATQFSGVGSYPIAITLGSNPNYSISPTNSELIITPKSATVTPVASSKYCGQRDPISFTGTTSGFLVSDNIIVNYSRTGGESAGIYTISASISSSPSTVINNYNITYNSANFTILGINSVDASASSTPVALGSVATLSAKIVPAVSGVTVYFSLSSGVGNVQTYTGITDANGLASTQVSSLVVDLYKVIATAGSGCAVSTEAYMPVYDPNGSFVTGGGWINSPAGAYTANLSLVGKANFGFNAKYKKGNNQVDGNTEFQFKAGDLNFKSTLHESGSLVISGRKATYRGDGTINGISGYKFTLVAIDGDYNGAIAPDQFRIKIWGPNGVVYDNGLGADENSEVSTVLSGGSIVIHEVKKKGSAKDISTEKTHSTMFSDVAQDPILFNVVAYPNPSINYFTLSVETGSTENVQVLLYDSTGRLLKVIDRKVGETIQFGEDLPRGTYIAKITQGVESKTINLMKK